MLLMLKIALTLLLVGSLFGVVHVYVWSVPDTVKAVVLLLQMIAVFLLWVIVVMSVWIFL